MLEEIVDIVLSNILEIIATVLSLVVAYYVIPYIKSDLIPFLKEKHLYDTVKKFVQAAEKLAESGIIDKIDKKAYVIRLLEDNGVVVDDKTTAFIESCVKELDIVTSVVYEEIIEEIDAEAEPEIEAEVEAEG